MKKSCALLIGLGLLLCSCTQSNNDINAIYSRINRNDAQIKVINEQLGIGGGSNVVVGQAEMWSQMQAMQQDLNMLKGQMAELTQDGGAKEFSQLSGKVNRMEIAMRQMASQLALELLSLDAAPTEGVAQAGEPEIPAPGATIPQFVAIPQTSAPQSATPDGAPTLQQPENSLANTLYNAGTKAFSDRKYPDAVKIFADFINTYPTHKLASNAYFWQGESYYQIKEYNNAIMAYQQVIEKFPGSAKLQSSMFKQGVSLYYNGKRDAGKIRLEELMRKYPKSPEADRAKKFLEQNPS
jgi:tol-pal system protein YbgF